MAPTLVVGATEDLAIPDAHARLQAAGIPGARGPGGHRRLRIPQDVLEEGQTPVAAGPSPS